MPRQVGKYGRNPLDPARPRLTLERYLDPRVALAVGGLEPVPLDWDVDRASEVASWPMYLNDTLGDCTIAEEGHMFGAVTRYAQGDEVLFADAEIQTVYSRVGGYVPGEASTDNGCVIADVLADARAVGMTDTSGKVHKVAGYAMFGNPADEELLGQVLAVFGTICTGINVQQQMEAEFSDGKPWTWRKGAPSIGGHCVALQRRFGTGAAPLEYVTWGALQTATPEFQAHAVEEAWAVVTEDWVRANGTTIDGINLEQLLADMELV
jgi:hypothetical protein